MVRITIDDELKKQLLAAEGEVELCDASGRILALARPTMGDPMEGWVPYTPEPTEEELERLSQSKERGISTSELIELLRKTK